MIERVNEILASFEEIIKKKCSRIKLEQFDFEDLCQESRIAALEAIRLYDQTKGASLNTWVSRCINQKISDLIAHSSYRKRRNYAPNGTYTLPIPIAQERSIEDGIPTITESSLPDGQENPEDVLVFNDLVEKVRARLGARAKRLFDLKIGMFTALEGSPTPAELLYYLVRREYCQKRIAHLQGEVNRGSSTLIVRNEHFAKALNTSVYHVKKARQEIERSCLAILGKEVMKDYLD